MNVTVTGLVVRVDGVVVDFVGIQDAYSDIILEYSSDYVTVDELIAYRQNVFGINSDSIFRNEIESLQNGLCFTLQCEARHMPSLGRMVVSIETREIVWE